MFSEIQELQKELKDILMNVQNTEDILEIGAKEFTKDLLKLPKPKSKIKAAGYTHLIDSFAYQKSTRHKGEVNVGWGKYYGPFVEHGTSKTKSNPHLQPLFKRNENKYYNLMVKKIYK